VIDRTTIGEAVLAVLIGGVVTVIVSCAFIVLDIEADRARKWWRRKR
jgi:hypothetical protein